MRDECRPGTIMNQSEMAYWMQAKLPNVNNKPSKPQPYKPNTIDFKHVENGTLVSHFNGDKHIEMVFTEKKELISYLRKVL